MPRSPTRIIANRPGVEEQDWGMTEMTVTDPFGNRIRFGERTTTADVRR